MKLQKFKLRLLPVILFTAVVILIVRVHSYSVDLGYMPDIPLDSSTKRWDLFCYMKSNAIFVIAIYALLTMIFLMITGRLKIKKTPVYIPMAVYAITVAASYVFSDYKWLAFNGSVNRFEGTRTIMCYLFMLFYTMNVVESLEDVIIVSASTIISTAIACMIGLTQLLGADILLSDFANTLLTGTDTLSLNPNFNSGQVYQTVANMNYVGMYMALIVPVEVYIIYYFCSKNYRMNLIKYGIYNEKRIMTICLMVFFLLLMILNLFGAASLGGTLGIITALLSLLFIVIKNKKIKITLFSVEILLIIGAIFSIFIFGTDNHEITGHKQIDYIETGSDVVNMSIDGDSISIIYLRDIDGYELRDSDNNPVDIFWYADEEGIIQVDDERFCGRIELIPVRNENDIPSIIVKVRDNDSEIFGFTFYEDGAKFVNPYGNEVSLSKIDSIGFRGHLSAGSGRGFIWSRTLPLLKKRIFTGSGADTFLVSFPQNDYAGKYSSGTPLNITFDKPHNMYLNIAVGTGIVSMIAFLTLITMILWKAFRHGEDKQFIKVIAVGIVGFLIAGLFNDSTVCIMPMFYGLLGCVAAVSN